MSAPLAAREAYRLWAPSYAEETVVTLLDDELVADMTPPLAGLDLLDAGCGTGRRLRDCGAATAIGIDLSPEMLAAGRAAGLPDTIPTLVGDLRALPVADRAFDVVWCRLAIGHVPECEAVYAELSRVCRPGGRVIVSDFHPDAHLADFRRTFRHDGEVHEVEHYLHNVAIHRYAATQAGLRCDQVREARVGPQVRPSYERAGKLAWYEAQLGLPFVLALAFTKEG
ncbi:class I SAM-dependent methyltransferase [Sphingomonas sp. JC676]|uniref:class I SAM-dependent methyltransferase n=1 Tax=Sphingomonas sp. JC676 TaxID=2768065 RepID=UPI0016583A88|nr:class I SAM-dependent methyltransferase [Sphingomonas sp. JC676]MBC9033493.1 class I SAM-dependent methyltransferase [Sphingomonas sp. JC676]